MNKKSKQINLDFHKTIQQNAEKDRERNQERLNNRVMEDALRFNPRNYKSKPKGKKND